MRCLLGFCLALTPLFSLAASSFMDCGGNECQRVNLFNNPASYNTALGATETSNGGSTARITTISANTQVFVGAAMIKRVIVTASTAATITIFDDADGTCNAAGALQKTGALPLAVGVVQELGIEVSAGLCILSGAGALDITVVYLP